MTAPLNAPPGQPYGWLAPPPVTPRRHWRTGVVAAIAALSVLIGTGIGAGIYAALDSNSGPEAPVTMPMPSGTVDIGDHAAAQQKTCEVLRSGYKSVAAAIDNLDQLNKRPWTDPELLASVDALANAANRLSSDLENSLTAATPQEFRVAIQNYVAGLRAVSLTESAHASNVQENGTALFYNQVVDAPLQMCGIPN